VRIAVKIGPEHAQKIYGTLKGFGIQKEEWERDGSLIVVVEMPAGLQGSFYDRINKATAGSAQTKIIK
jgi:ribosome maturation protein SDO1